MDVRFNDDEIAEALTVLVNRMADEAGLSDKDRAQPRWRDFVSPFTYDHSGKEQAA